MVRESYQTITLKSGKIIPKSDLAVKRPTEIKKGSPCKKNQLFKFYTTKGPRAAPMSSRSDPKPTAIILDQPTITPIIQLDNQEEMENS